MASVNELPILLVVEMALNDLAAAYKTVTMSVGSSNFLDINGRCNVKQSRFLRHIKL